MTAALGTRRPCRGEELGRTCPSCRFPLKEGLDVVGCPDCGTPHHADCWGDVAACAVLGCSDPGKPAAAPSSKAAPPPAVTPAATAAWAPSPSNARSGSTMLVAALAVLALVVAGAAAAVVLSLTGSGGGHATANVVVVRPLATAAAASPPATATTAATPPAAATPPRHVSSKPTPAVVKRLLTKYYGAVLAGDYGTAWRLLTPSYKRWKAGNGGQAKWREQEARNRERLRLDALRVRIRGYDAASHIATISVGGITYKTPGGGSCRYQGVTWVRRVGGRWLYDQGYVQSPARVAQWRPRAQETLGVPCETDGY